MCNCCCCCSSNEPAQPPAEPGQTPGGEVQERCRLYRVTVHKVDIREDGEWGNAHWQVYITVNGQTKVWDSGGENVRSPVTVELGYEFLVNVPTDTATINLQVGGYEVDLGRNSFWDPDDPLPNIAKTYDQAQNWGIGYHQESAISDEFSYVVHYEISCAETETVVVSRSRLLEWAKQKTGLKEESALMRYALGKGRRVGFRFVQQDGDLMFFSGPKLVRNPSRQVEPGIYYLKQPPVYPG